MEQNQRRAAAVCKHSNTLPGLSERHEAFVNLRAERGKQVGLGMLDALLKRHWADLSQLLASCALEWGLAWRLPVRATFGPCVRRCG